MDEELWKIQYEKILDISSDEASRFWTRFQVFLAVNGGLLAVFPIVLGLYSVTLEELTQFTKSMLIGISVAGIIESILWFTITLSGRETQIHLRKKIQDLEKMNLKLEFHLIDSKEERKKPWIYSITVLALFLPLLFIGVWIFILLLGISTDFGIPMPPIEST